MKRKILKSVGYSVAALFLIVYVLVLSVDARSWGDSLNRCDLGLAITESLIWGIVVFALHGPIFGWFFKRLDDRFHFGLMLGLLPALGAFCVSMYFGCALAPGTLKFVYLASLPALVALWWIFYTPIDSSFAPYSFGAYRGVAVTKSFLISVPFFGPVYILIWIALSWGLPALFGLTWKGEENPRGLRDKVFWILFAGVIVTYWSAMAYFAYL